MSTKDMSERPTTVLQSLNAAMHRLMAGDSRVVVLGEDILDPYGGAFKVTRGLSTQFPDRVLTTPISEGAIVGLANGLALRGMRPIAEIMFGDFVTLAADQLINHAAKFRWMYNEQVRVPLVVRTPMGGRRGYGPTHSQSLEKHILGVPGLWVAAPHALGDPGSLLEQSVALEDPVVFVESKVCYGRFLTRPAELRAEEIRTARSPFPTLHLTHRGGSPDGVIFCYGGMAPVALEAVERLRDVDGIRVDLVVVAQLSPTPTDHLEALLQRGISEVIAYAEEASSSAGWGAELVATIEEIRASIAPRRSIRHLRIGGAHTPIASSKEMELHDLPSAELVAERLLECF